MGSLFLLTLLALRGVLDNGFVLNWDDFEYVTENHMIQSWTYLPEMITSSHSANWHPLTWFSHALDYQLYGLDPWGHHLTSLILHGLNTCWIFALFVLLASKVRGASHQSVLAGGIFTALLFGLHPLRIESVAWVSERKDLLCSFFFFSTIGSYLSYVQEKKNRGYAVLVFLFALALMSKPMAVTLPVVLLLLDVFPLERWCTLKDFPHLLKEKIPLFALSLATSVITLLSQGSTGAVRTLSETSLSDRIINAFHALWFYLEKTLWPRGLLPFYPAWENPSWASMEFLLGLALFLGATLFGVYKWRKGNPAWMIAWLFYLVTVLPVIGIIKVGTQAMADRYTYIPILGPVFLIGAGVMILWQKHKVETILATVAMVFVLSMSSSKQIKIWKDGESLWLSVVQAFPGKVYRAHANLAVYYFQGNQLAKAEEQLNTAQRIQPNQVDTLFYMGMVYTRQGRWEEAREALQKALLLNPEDERVLYRLGVLYEKTGQKDLAENEYGKALNLNPEFEPVRVRLGQLYLRTGRTLEAEEQFKNALALNPESEEVRNNLGALYYETGKFQQAEAEYLRVINTWPQKVRAYTNLGVLYYETRRFDEAEKSYHKVLEMEPNHIEAINNLGILYLEMDRKDEALSLLQSAKTLAPNRVDTLYYLGIAYMAGENWLSAEAEFRAALSLNPDNAEIYGQLGVLLARQEKWQKAQEAFQSALRLNPSHRSAKTHLEQLMRKTKNAG